MTGKKRDKKIITKMVDAFLKTIPEPDTPGREKLIKEVSKLSETNCWWLEYELGKILRVIMPELEDES